MNDSTISRPALAYYMNQIDLATSFSDQIDCGRLMLQIKRDLQKLGLTIRSATELYYRDLFQTYPDLLHGPDPFSHTRPNETIQTQPSEPEQIQTSEKARPQDTNNQDTNNQKPPPFHDPMDEWVIPWTHSMDREIANKPIPDKDIRHVMLMQPKRYKFERADNHVVWLHDICRREGFHIPKEYWDWWNSLSPERQEAATRR